MPASSPVSSGSLIVIIAIVCLTIGYVFGWLISMLRSSKENKKNALDARIGSVPPLNSEPAVTDKAALRLIRDPDRGLQVDLEGSRVGDATKLSMEQRQRLETLLRETANWMGLSYQLGAPTAQLLPPATAQPVRRVTGPLAPADIPSDPNEARPPSILSGVTNALADAMAPNSAAKKNAPKSIVEQIDEVLQGMLPGTPLENEKVYLAESPQHGVVVRVGAQIYEGIDAVPEGDVKKLLRAAVAEWEKQQEKMLRRTTG